jgi:hypothetical protein
MTDDHGDETPEHEEGRVTSPMQEYTTSQVGYGAAVFLVGLALTFGIGFLL